MSHIWIKGKKYYLWGMYTNREKANQMAKKMRKTHGSRYFICAKEGFMFLDKKHYLYLDKPRKIW